MSKKNIQQILAGDYWVHWTYTQDEWRRFAEQSWARSRKVILIGFGCAVLLTIACSLLLIPVYSQLFDLKGGDWEPGLFIAMAILSGLFITAGLLVYMVNHRQYRKRLEQTNPYVYISRLGIYRPEGYVSLAGLYEAKLQQRNLRFKCNTRHYIGRRVRMKSRFPCLMDMNKKPNNCFSNFTNGFPYGDDLPLQLTLAISHSHCGAAAL